ncbi:vitelline membrane outer layer protein 1 homolog [Dendropsophus ebraccatus]|uniref:vitelline membrane outer layer protein 1 homolog n=1 Tax=Dendropsophus ebraccatus TaxID=150705 RepID=UPI003831DCDB
MLTLVLLLLPIQASLAQDMYSSVPNGGNFGDWGTLHECPSGSRLTGFYMKVDRKTVTVDNSAVNAIFLFCTDISTGNRVGTVTSAGGNFGTDGPEYNCKPGTYVVAFALSVGKKNSFDDTGINNFRFKCSDGTTITGDGMPWGIWGGWSDKCPNGMSAIKTRFQHDQGPFKDDTALNDAQFLCISNSQWSIKG